MRITFAKKELPTNGVVVVTLGAKGKLGENAAKLDTQTKGALKKALKFQECKGKHGEITSLVAPAGTKYDAIILVALGDKKDITETSCQKLGGKLVAQLNALRAKSASIIIEEAKDSVFVATNIAEGTLLRDYNFDKYRTQKKYQEKHALHINTLKFYCDDHTKAQKIIKETAAVAAGVEFARNLVTEPSNVLFPKHYASLIKKELTKLGAKVKILGEKQMTEEGMNLLLGVGQGSAKESQLVIIEWNGDPQAKKDKKAPLGFVGKGVTFDTGGISIKPSANMWDMKYDMGGSAAVVGLMKALAGRNAKVNAVGVVGLVENMPGSNAQRPGDVVTSMSGQTVEVLNTDAEGRLVLADALTYIQKYYKPSSIVNLATLTGAIVIALGNEHAGLFSNNDKLSDQLTKAGLTTGEKLWRFPLSEAYDQMLDSPIADMMNISLGRGAGSITAAQFLKRYIENDTPWAHLDIAGMAWEDKGSDLNPKGASGFGVRLLNDYVKREHEAA